MAYQLLRIGDYPGTDLPLFGVFPAEDPKSHHIGEVWAVGVKGVAGKWIPTGVRYQLNGGFYPIKGVTNKWPGNSTRNRSRPSMKR